MLNIARGQISWSFTISFVRLSILRLVFSDLFCFLSLPLSKVPYILSDHHFFIQLSSSIHITWRCASNSSYAQLLSQHSNALSHRVYQLCSPPAFPCPPHLTTMHKHSLYTCIINCSLLVERERERNFWLSKGPKAL